jgi:hypothetical protein
MLARARCLGAMRRLKGWQRCGEREQNERLGIACARD